MDSLRIDTGAGANFLIFNMDTLSGTIQTATIDQFNINGLFADGVAFDLTTNEIVILGGGTEITRVTTQGFSADINAGVSLSDALKCEARVKIGRSFTYKPAYPK